MRESRGDMYRGKYRGREGKGDVMWRERKVEVVRGYESELGS